MRYHHCKSTHSLSTTAPLANNASLFSIVSLLTSNKIIAHCWLSVKRLKTRSLGRTVCFLQIRSLSLLDIPDLSSTSSYVSLERLSSLLQNFMCSLYRIFCTGLSISLCWLSKASSFVLLANWWRERDSNPHSIPTSEFYLPL
jgi:hypothetical protein